MVSNVQTYEHLLKPLYRTFQVKRFEFAASFSVVTQHVNTIEVDKFDFPCKKPHYCSIGIILGRRGERLQLHRMFTLFDWKNVYETYGGENMFPISYGEELV